MFAGIGFIGEGLAAVGPGLRALELRAAPHEGAAVFGQLAPEQLHHVGPGRDGITGAKAHAGGDEPVSKRLISIHDHLAAAFMMAVHEVERLDEIAERISIAGMESGQRVLHNAFVFAAESFLNEPFQFRYVQVEHAGDEAKRIDVLAFVLGRSANGFDAESRNGNADLMIQILPFGFGLHVIGIIQHDPALLQ